MERPIFQFEKFEEKKGETEIEIDLENRERAQIAKEFGEELEKTPKGHFYKKLQKIAAALALAGFLTIPKPAIAPEPSRESIAVHYLHTGQVEMELQQKILEQIRTKGGVVTSPQLPETIYRPQGISEIAKRESFESEMPFYNKAEVILGEKFIKQNSEKAKEYMEKISSAIKASVMLEGVSGNLGSGVIVKTKEGKKFILTNQHVCGEKKYMKVHFSNRATGVVFKVLEKNETTDVAVLEIPESRALEELMVNTEALEIDDKPVLEKGEKIAAVGNPWGFPFAVAMGEVSRDRSEFDDIVYRPDERFRYLEMYTFTQKLKSEELPRKFVKSKGEGIPGMSGSPVICLDREGKPKIAGLVCRTWLEEGSRWSGKTSAIPAETITFFLQGRGLTEK